MTAPPESARLAIAWRAGRARLASVAAPAGLALVVFAGVLLAFGKNPIKAYVDIFSSTLGSPYGFSETLVKMTPLVLTAVAVAAAAAHGRARVPRRGALGARLRPPARQGLGQRDDLHPPHELRRHPVAELRRVRAVEGPRRRQLPADGRVRPGRDAPGAGAEPRASRPRPGAGGGRTVRVLRLPHALGPRDARHRRQRRRRPTERHPGRSLRGRADVHRRRPRRPRGDV